MEKTKNIINPIIRQLKKIGFQPILATIITILIILVVYERDLRLLANEALNNQVLSHILLAPFFACILLYLKKDIVKASIAIEKYQETSKTKYIDELLGITLCLIAFLIYWYGSRTFYPLQYHILSLPLFIMGIALILFNLKTLYALIFPILFLLFLTPPPMELIYAAGGFIANLETQTAYTILKTLGTPVTLSSKYGPPTITVTSLSTELPSAFTIDLPCSGIYTLIAFTMFSTFLITIINASNKSKILLFITGLIIFEFLNITRITTIVYIGYLFGEETAMTVFHLAAGLLLILIGMILTLLIAEKTLKIKILPKPQEAKPCPECKKALKNKETFCLNCGKFLNPFNKKVSSKTWAKLTSLLLGCLLITLVVNAPTYAIAEGPIKVTSNTSWKNATNVLPKIENYTLKFLYRDAYYEKIARQDAALIYAYFPNAPSNSTVYVSINVANSISNLHSWEVCLITWQTAQGRYPIVSVLDSKEIQLLENPPIVARYLTFNHPEKYTQITLYWFEKATFNTGITVEQKYIRISLIILTNDQTDYKRHENKLLFIGRTIANHWQPLKIQSLISLGIPAIQLTLAACITFLTITITVQQLYQSRKKARNLKLFKGFASKEDKLLLKTIINLTRSKRNIETRDILKALQSKTGKSPKLSDLIEKLNHFEEYGFIKKDIAFTDSYSKLVWKVLIAKI